MVNYAAEIEAIFAEHQRRAAMHSQDLAEIEQRTADTAHALEARATAEMKDFWDEHAEKMAKARTEAEEKERQEMDLREQQDAIARAAAYRRANQTVAPIDDEDEDDEYYRRQSWLV